MAGLQGVDYGQTPDLVLGSLTLAHLRPPELIEVAARAGFKGISVNLWSHSLADFPMQAGGDMMRRTLHALGNTGLQVWDIEGILLSPAFCVEDYSRMMDSAALLKGRHVVVICEDNETQRVVENLHKLAELTAGFKLGLAVEFMVYRDFSSLEQTIDIVRQTGRNDISILIDALHLHRSSGKPADMVGLAPGLIAYAQLCDCPLQFDGHGAGVEALRKEAQAGRLLPGEGELPLVDFVNALPRGTVLSVEVPHLGYRQGIDDNKLALDAYVAPQNIVAQSKWALGSTSERNY